MSALCQTTLPLDRMRRAVDIAKHRFNPEASLFLIEQQGGQNLDFPKMILLKKTFRVFCSGAPDYRVS